MHVINLAKTLGTLGLYYFWAKVQVRRYMYAHTEFQGDRFAYHGQGRELLAGWAKVGGIFGILAALAFYAEWVLQIRGAGLLAQVAAFCVGLLLLPVATVGATRFRLSRTSWRGIRFSFHGRAAEFTRILLKGLVLSALSMGMYTPFMQVAMRRYMVTNTRYGDLIFGFDGDANALVGPYIVSSVLYLPTFTLSRFWYKATRDKHLWLHTLIGKNRFICTVTPYGLFKLSVRTFALTYLTFGLGKPWADVLRMKYLCDNLKLDGKVDADSVVQRLQRATAAGEGLTDFIDASFFDIEVGL